MKKETFKVKGMDCTSCERVLKLDIGEIKGVKSVKASYKTGIVEVEGEGFDVAAIKKAIKLIYAFWAEAEKPGVVPMSR